MGSEKVTLFFLGAFGTQKIEASRFSAEAKPYAQYTAAVYATFLPRGKRKLRQIIQSYRPTLIVVAGWDLPDPADPMRPTDGGQITRFTSYAPEYAAEHNAFAEYLAKTCTVLADFREREAA